MQMIYTSTISLFFFTLSVFLLQLFKLNCNCFPLNAVVASVRLDVVAVAFAALIQIEFERNEKKSNVEKKETTAKNLQFLLAAPFK